MEKGTAVSNQTKYPKGKVLLRIVTVLFCTVLLLFAALNVTMTVMNTRSAQGPAFLLDYTATVMSYDSMAGDKHDSIAQDSVMLLHKADYADLVNGTVVSYLVDGEILTGRVIGHSTDSDGETVYTLRADNEEKQYSTLLTADNYLGVVVGSSRWVGDLALFATTDVGRVIFLWIPVLICLLVLLAQARESLLARKRCDASVVAGPVVAEPIIEEPIIEEPITEEPITEELSDEPEDEETAVAVGNVVFVKYRRSFLARLIQSSDELKARYSLIKNELLSYKGVKARNSWGCETFKGNRQKLAGFAFKGKTLYLCLALDPAAYVESKYSFADLSGKARYRDIPFGLKIRSPRSVKHAIELIETVMERVEMTRVERPFEDFVLPYESDEALLAKGLVKSNFSDAVEAGDTVQELDLTEMFANLPRGIVPMESVSVTQADDLLTNEEAEALIEEEPDEPLPAPATEQEAQAESRALYRESPAPRQRKVLTRKGIVNIDTLDRYFRAGETVTLDELRARKVPGVDARTGAFKLLARGRLSKPLIVYADEFSLKAVKMLLLTGGKAFHRKGENR